MDYQISCDPTFSLLDVNLEQGESIVSESGAMAWMSPGLRTETSTRGGIMSGLKRAFLSGESFFQNTYHAETGPESIAFSPGPAGDIVAYEMNGNELMLQKGAYLASTPDIVCDSKFQGLKGLFNEGLFILRVHGNGTLFFNSYGAIHEIDVQGEYLVDNGYAVGWEPTLEYKITKARKIRSFLFSDQLLLRFSGHGKLWVQTRSATTLANWVYPFRPVESNND